MLCVQRGVSLRRNLPAFYHLLPPPAPPRGGRASGTSSSWKELFLLMCPLWKELFLGDSTQSRNPKPLNPKPSWKELFLLMCPLWKEPLLGDDFAYSSSYYHYYSVLFVCMFW